MTEDPDSAGTCERCGIALYPNDKHEDAEDCVDALTWKLETVRNELSDLRRSMKISGSGPPLHSSSTSQGFASVQNCVVVSGKRGQAMRADELATGLRKLNLTNVALARAIGKAPSTITSYLAARRRIPDRVAAQIREHFEARRELAIRRQAALSIGTVVVDRVVDLLQSTTGSASEGKAR